MHIRIYLVLLVIVLLMIDTGRAGPNLDSLEASLDKPTSDTSKLTALADLAWYYRNIQPSKAIYFAMEGLEIADKYGILKYQSEFNATLGANYLIIKDIAKAIKQYETALKYAYQLRDTFSIASFLNNLGVAYQNIRQYDKALEYSKKSSEYYLKSKKPAKISSSYINIATIYSDMNQFERAIEYYNKALKLETEIQDTNGLIIVYNNLAMIYQNKRNFSTATTYLTKTLELSRKSGDSNSVVTALINLGMNYEAQGNYLQAINMYKLAEPLAGKVEDIAIKISLFHYYGTAYLGLKKYTEAIKYTMSSLEISEKYNDLKSMSESYKQLEKIYFAQHDFKKAHYYLSMGMSLRDSLLSREFNETLAIETARNNSEMEAKYNLEKKNDEIEYLEKKREISRIYIIILWAIIIFNVITLIVIFVLYRIIKKKNKVLSESISAIKIKDEQLSEMLRMKDKFFHIVSHDLKNPLSLFMNISDYMSKNYKELTEDDIQQFMFDLKRSSKNLNSLLDNLVLWSNIQTDNFKNNPELFDISLICNHLKNEWIKIAKDKSIVFNFSCQHPLHIFADMNMILIVMKNLVGNAIKYSFENGQVAISLYSRDNDVVFDVRDNGVGIESERLDKLFKYDKSFKTKGTKFESGTGLGLILSKHLIELNNGHLEFDSKSGEGSVFKFVIPMNDQL